MGEITTAKVLRFQKRPVSIRKLPLSQCLYNQWLNDKERPECDIPWIPGNGNFVLFQVVLSVL
jgi:hypothetical protein